jgi:hypothetical protein
VYSIRARRTILKAGVVRVCGVEALQKAVEAETVNPCRRNDRDPTSRNCFAFLAVPLAGIVEPPRSRSHITPFTGELLADAASTPGMT